MYKTTKCRRTYSLTNKIKSTVMLLMLFVSFGSYAQYCDVTSTSTTYGVGSFITTNGISNISNSTGGGSYSDYTAMSVAQFEGGLDVQFSITPTTGTHGIGLWIDWNNDGDFDDAGEQIYNSGSYVSVANGTITIPEGTPLGDYRIRVVANWLSTTPTPCGNLGNAAYGEAEDYTFSVIEQPDCMPPSGINAVEVTDSTAEIEWAAPTGQDTWFVYITDFGNPAPDDTTTDYEIATSSPYTIDDLDSKELDRCFESCMLFVQAVDEFVFEELYPGLPLTQSEMHIDASESLELSCELMNSALQDLLVTLSEDGKKDLLLSQKYWLKYADRWTAFSASVAEGGSLYQLLACRAKKELVELRTDEIKRWESLGN